MASPSTRKSTESFNLSNSPPQSQSQFPFPQHDWNIRSSSTSRYQPRRGSTSSSIHSFGGALDTSFKSSIGAVREHNQNAISTLLQPPIVRTGMLPHTSASAALSQHKPPSTKDIPPVTLPNIPHIEPSAFSPYLSQVGNLYDAFQRAKAEAEGDTASIIGRDSARKDDSVDTSELGLRGASPAATPKLSGGVFSPSGSPKPKRRASGSKRALPTVTPLSTIPNIYFDENFRLENPRTFDVVSERSEVVRPVQSKSSDDVNIANGSFEPPQQPGRKALATNAILQEKLSWYMDTVEVHLISSISTASTSFFAALGSLRELQSEASDSVAKIKAVREDLRRLDEQMAVGGLKIVDMKRRRENLRRLTDTTDQLHAVMTGLSHCDEVVDKGDLEVAINRLGTVERLISGDLDTSDPSNDASWIPAHVPAFTTDLRHLRALDGVGEGLQDLKYRIGKGFEARFLETLLSDLRQHVKSVNNRDTLTRWVTTSQRARGQHSRLKSVLPAYLNTSNSFRHDLRTNLMGLSSSNFTSQASSAFRDAILREMKVLIRHYLPSSTDDDAESMTSVSTRSGRGHSQQDKNSILARNLRAMDPADAEEFFVNIFTDIGEAIRRLSIQIKVLLDVTSGVSTPPASSGGLRSPPRSPNIGSIDGYLGGNIPPSGPNALQEELMQALDMSSLLGQAVDAAQSQITKLLKVRSEATTNLPLDRFLRYFNLCRLFADECEAVSGRSGAALKGVVNNHINEFIPKFADFEKQQLIHSMDSDRWDPKDFDDADNAVLARILQGMTSDHGDWTERGDILADISEHEAVSSQSQSNGTTKEKSKNPTAATVDEEKYIVSESSSIVLRGIDRFEALLANIPSMTGEVSASLCDYLKLFNSRLCQLILGAGARHSAGLKNINTKHLAIASQTLSLGIAILPYIREFARRHASGARSSLAEYDNVKRLYQDQQVKIHEKLTEVLSGRATVHTRSLKKVEWDQDTERDVSANMESLTKDTVTLHKVITKYLNEMTVRMIMGPVFESYREQVGALLKEAVVKTPAGKARLLRDAKLFDTRLSHIDGAGNVGAYLIQLVEAKVVKEAPGAKEKSAVEEQAADSNPPQKPDIEAT
ncbi:Vps54-domain-containing protein [Aaosphaeria arxii CBS 175.79]|uniref:Vacuolar protein sorting-associated protein 54 n=1 Tax=Aaosphaeria arxii CBS 175.79 TaxID=1450172 RepID=A0A6A5Y7D1_9PLEO|nr:Vps54-domain-containing protein [Aaosphaeria arxii CBS 175.79]KAF2021199.1 Vps54-domain-containing protein [Aaosphaeria arxii CBS 175.79]